MMQEVWCRMVAWAVRNGLLHARARTHLHHEHTPCISICTQQALHKAECTLLGPWCMRSGGEWWPGQ
eukprot:666770-Pelagomonas_calceolata.AAC.1